MSDNCRSPMRSWTCYLAAMLVALLWFNRVNWADDRADWFAELSRAARADPAMDAAGAVDGRIDGHFGFHTNEQDSPWWQVDLGQRRDLGRVVIYNRTVAADRAKTLTIRLSEDGLRWNTVYEHDGTVFFGHQDNQPLEVPLDGVAARYVRLQLREKTWLHLDEVQVFGASDKSRNLAAGQPADQSSTSSWSKKNHPSPDTPDDAVLRDVQTGERIIRRLLIPCGESAGDLQTRLTQLTKDGARLDDLRWIRLYSASRNQHRKVVTVRQRWQWLDVAAWRLAVRDLIDSYGDRYSFNESLLTQLESVAARHDQISEGLARGDADTLRAAERILALQRDSLLANPLLDFGQLLMVKRPGSTPRLGLPANFHGN